MRRVGAQAPTSRRARVVAALVAALVSTFLLVGCAAPSARPALRASADPDAPALTAGQVHRILRSLDAAVAAAPSSGALASRVDSAELALRRATATIDAHVKGAPAPATVSGTLLASALPAATAWPRWFLAVRRATPTAAPELLVLTQAGARDPYHLSACATLLPGVTLPHAVTTAGGSAVTVGADSTAAGTAPRDVLAHYADVLTKGSASQWAQTTASDALRTQVGAEQDAERAGVSQYDTYTATHTPQQGAVWALRLEGGGELVLGVLDGARTFAPKGPLIDQRLTPDLAALAGRGDAPSGITVSTAEVVVLQVPRSGPTRLLAVQRGVTGVHLP